MEGRDFVADMFPWIAQAAASIAPITGGVGVTNKILEAFAADAAAVATRLPRGDLPVRDGEHLTTGDEAGTFADAVLQLLGDCEMRRRKAANVRRLLEEHYDWEAVTGRMEQLMLELIRDHRPGEDISSAEAAPVQAQGD